MGSQNETNFRARIAFLLSFAVPGLGHIYIRQRESGSSILCVMLGIVFSAVISTSYVIWITMGILYLSLGFSSARDAYHIAKGRTIRKLRNDSLFAVVVMLLFVGPFAIPLLWRSPDFTKRAKINWTIFVIVIAIMFFFTVYYFEKIIDTITQAATPYVVSE